MLGPMLPLRCASGAAPAVLLALAAVACDRTTAPPRNAILISIDTLRADHLGCYGYALPTSPRIDVFAREGVVFEATQSTAPWTLPAHASLLTGLWPSRHGARTVRDGLAPGVATLATRLSVHGYDTAAFVNSFFLGPGFGLERGFARFDQIEEDHSPRGAAPGIVDTALAWLDQPRDRRFFLFLHFFDVHSDYRSEPAIEALFVEQRGPEDGTTRQIRGLAALTSRPPEAVELLSRLYDAGIRQLDLELGRFLDALERSGRASDTLVVVTSDHGEEFGEHGSLLHGSTHYEEMLRVPLLLRGPGLPAGLRIDTPVSLVDVAPTLLDVLGVGPDGAPDGRSLRPLWEGRGADGEDPRALIAEAAPALEGDRLVAVRMGPYKLVVDESDGSRALYDLTSDAGEREDVAADHAYLVDHLSRVAEQRAVRRAGGPVLPLPAKRRAQLRALGYAVE